MVNCDDDASSFKSLCSICHKNLEPFVEDLQVISVCGHVFHEFCLQVSFGFFESVKRYSCPVCKQRCKPEDAARLYFESVGKSPVLNLSQSSVEDSEALRREVKELNEELRLCKERANKELAHLKNEALKQHASVRQMLQMKTEELDKSALECSRLQERNITLTKELAAFKLVSDLDLVEKEVSNFAAFGNGGNSEDTIDVLKKSLAISTRNRKELMAQRNLLERAEARRSKKLEKAKGKINKLNTKVEELSDHCNLLQHSEAHYSRKIEKSKGKITKLKTKVQELTDHSNLLEQGEARYIRQLEKAKGKINKLKTRVQKLDSAVEVKKETLVLRPTDQFESMGTDSGTRNDTKESKEAPADNLIPDDVKQVQHMQKKSPVVQPLARPDAVIHDNLNQVQPILNTSKESPITEALPKPVSAYFSGGLLGPDGTKRFLGKWCKRSQNNNPVTNMDSSKDAGHSVVVVSDEEDTMKDIPLTKRGKYEDKSKHLQSKGCLQHNTSLEGYRGAQTIDL